MRAKWVIVILAVCLVATVAAIAYAAGKTSAPELIRAQKFELVDAEGRVRIEMSMGVNGQAPGIRLLDEKGQRCAALSLLPDGRPGLLFLDEKGRGGAKLSLEADGRPILWLNDEKRKVRAALGLGPDGSPGLLLCDWEGEVMWSGRRSGR